MNKFVNGIRRHWKILAAGVGLLLVLIIAFFNFPTRKETAHDYADRVFYADGGTREWGTFCRHKANQWFSVYHVTINGEPVVGPVGEITMANELNDWSLINIDPESLKAEDFPELTPGTEGFIAGFPAVDRDGEIIPGRVYLKDNNESFVWVELLYREDGSHPEGVVGGVSGSCFIVDGKVAGVVHANGFSHIEGTTNTWALVVPIHTIINDIN